MSDFMDSQPQTTMPDSNINISTTALASVTKLTVGNMYAWKRSLKMYLKMNGIFYFVETRPDRPGDTVKHSRFYMREAAVLYAIHNTIKFSNRALIALIENQRMLLTLVSLSTDQTVALS